MALGTTRDHDSNPGFIIQQANYIPSLGLKAALGIWIILSLSGKLSKTRVKQSAHSVLRVSCHFSCDFKTWWVTVVAPGLGRLLAQSKS